MECESRADTEPLMSSEDLALLRGFSREGVITWQRGDPVSAAEFCGAAKHLGDRLPRARYAINLCEENPNFLLGTAAALVAGQTLIFPPSRLALALTEIRRLYPDSYCLVDKAETGAGPDFIAVSSASEFAASTPLWPPPPVAAAHVAMILFTSGSTREPRPHAKTWGELVKGSESLVRSFGQPRPGAAIVGTVPPQHMFGLETTIMLPLQSGTPVLDARPTYPADPADLPRALTAVGKCGFDAIWLMTTPLQLRVLHRGLPSLAGVEQIITATMPLERELASEVERDWRARVGEIFGCTEGGILATRRPSQNSDWAPAVGLRLSLTSEGDACFEGGHLAVPLTISDRIALLEPADGATRFEWLGRDEDLVKIAGKRASLAGLAAQALAVDGVRDAAFFFPTPTDSRVAAIIVAPGRAPSDIRAELAQRIDPAFLPRPMVFVDALPRDPNGKIPVNTLREILRAEGAVEALAEPPLVLEHRWSVDANHPSLPGHFPGRPILPGVVLLETVQAVLAEHGLRVHRFVHTKFHQTVTPSSALSLRIEVVDGLKARFAIKLADQTAVSGDILCSPSRIEL